MRSRMASASVGSPMTSCQLATGSWLVMRMEPRPWRSSTMSMRSCRWLAERRSGRAEMARRAIVDLCEKLGDGGVQCGKREELPVAQLCDDEAGRNLHRNFHLGLVACPIRPRRYNGGVVVG